MRMRTFHVLPSSRCAVLAVSGLLTLALAPETAWAQKGASPDKAAEEKKGESKKGDAKKAEAKKKPMSEEETKEAAKKAFKAGEEKFAKSDWTGALADYQQADDLFPGFTPKFKIAACLDKLNRHKDAIAAYKRFLDGNPPPEKFGEKIGEAKARLDELSKKPGTLRLKLTPAEATVLVDGKPQDGAELQVAPGKHKLAVRAKGFETREQEIEIEAGEAKELAVSLEPAADEAPAKAEKKPASEKATESTVAADSSPAPSAAPSEGGGPSRLPAYIALGVAGGAAAVGTIFGLGALGAKSDFEAGGNASSDLAEQAESKALIADLAFGIALVAGATGVVLLVSGGKSEPAKTGFVLAPVVTPRSGGVGAKLRF